MSYNIMKKRAGFAGSTEGTIENIVDTHTDQTINGQKTITDLTASAFSSSATVYATAFVGDGSGLSGVGGGGGTPDGSNTQIQFNDDGAFGASANLTFATSSNTLEVAGDISASINISASSFYGDGSNLTNLGAANISGQLSASQVAHSMPLTNSAGILTAKTNQNRVVSSDPTLGIGLDTSTLTGRGGVNDSDYLITTDGSNNYYTIQFSTIESTLNIGGGNITGSNSIENIVLPTKINQSEISASTGISGAYFQGDGSGLTGVTGTPTPVGLNTEIQFNADGALGSENTLTFLTGSDTLVTVNLSASSNISGSSLYLQDIIDIAGTTFVDSSRNITVNKITASSVISSSANISGAAFYGDGRTLSGVPMQTAVINGILRVSNPTNQTITSDLNFVYDGADVTLDAGDFILTNGNITASGHVSASTFYGDGSNLTGISAGGNTFSRAEVTSTPYTASSSDYYIGVSTGSAAIVQLPLANTLVSGQTFIVKDESGNASLYNITVQTSGSDVIDGQSNQTIESDYGSISLYSNGTDKFFIF